jgi:hypothetical protein
VQFKNKEELTKFVEEIRQCAEANRKSLVADFLSNPIERQVLSCRIRP